MFSSPADAIFQVLSHLSDFFSKTFQNFSLPPLKEKKHLDLGSKASLTSLSHCFPSDRRSGTDWLGTLFLIRRMAWGETLIWTSSAWKKTALPGWAQRTGTANYTTFKLPPCLLSFIPLSVCAFVWVWCFGVCAWTCIYRQFVFSNPQTCLSGMDSSPLDINNFSPLMISLSAASSCSLHIFVRVWRKGGVVSLKGGSRFVPALCLITPSSPHPVLSLCIPRSSSHPSLVNLVSLLCAPMSSVWHLCLALHAQAQASVWHIPRAKAE